MKRFSFRHNRTGSLYLLPAIILIRNPSDRYMTGDISFHFNFINQHFYLVYTYKG